MVFCAGADIGSSRQIVRRFLTVKTLGLSLLVLLATNVGSLGGGLIMGYLMGVPFRDALLVSAGMDGTACLPSCSVPLWVLKRGR